MGARFWLRRKGRSDPAWWCFVQLSERKLKIESQVSHLFFGGSWKWTLTAAAHACRKLCFSRTSPGSCICFPWPSALAGCLVSGHCPASVLGAAADAALSISRQGALRKGARSAGLEAGLLTSALRTSVSQTRGKPAVAPERGPCRWQRKVLLLAPTGVLSPAWWISAVAASSWGACWSKSTRWFKNRWYLVINEVLKMRYKRLNCPSQLLGPYVCENIYLCFN